MNRRRSEKDVEPELITPDIAVIGGGSAGLSVAAGTAQLGLSTVLFEASEMGGDCLNHGCVPSKALLSAARGVQAMRDVGRYGVAPVAAPEVDWKKVRAHVRGAIAKIAPNDSVERFEALGVRVIREFASFADEETLVSKSARVQPRRIVIATGSEAVLPPVPGLDAVPCLTNKTIFDLNVLPDHLVVLGGGPIGSELGQAFARLGAKVTMVDHSSILPRAEPDHVEIVRKKLKSEGVTIVENCSVKKADRGKDGGIVLSIEERGRRARRITASHLLVAAGRRPVIDTLNLGVGGVSFTRSGVTTHASLRSVSNPRVWALGDAAGRGQFTHLAGWHAGVFIRNALFKVRTRADSLPLPAVTYIEPELAQLGLSEAQARAKHGSRIRVAKWSFDENDRAIAEGECEGEARIVTDRRGRILGASIIGQGAGDIIQLVGVAMSNGQGIRALTNFISPYPTRGEVVKRAAGQWYQDKLFSARTRRLVSFLQRIP